MERMSGCVGTEWRVDSWEQLVVSLVSWQFPSPYPYCHASLGEGDFQNYPPLLTVLAISRWWRDLFIFRFSFKLILN